MVVGTVTLESSVVVVGTVTGTGTTRSTVVGIIVVTRDVSVVS
jgi:hypothetical protein